MIFTPIQFSQNENGDWQNTGWLSNFTKSAKDAKQAISQLNFEEADKWITQFNQETNNGTQNLSKFFEKCKDPSLVSYLNNLKGGTATVEGYTAATKAESAAIETTGVVAKVTSAALKVLSLAGNMILWTAVSYGIEKLVEYVSNLKSASEKAKEELDTATQSLNDTNTKVNDLNTKLQDTNKQIETLQSKGSLTFVEQSQLTTLEQTSAQLQTQLEIQQALQKIEKEKKTSAAIKSIDAQSDEKINPFTGAVNTDNNIKAKSGMDGVNETLAFYSDRLSQVNKDQKEYNVLLAKGNNLTEEEKQKKDTLNYILKDEDDAGTTLKENLLNRAKAYQEEADAIDIDSASNKENATQKKQFATDMANSILKIVDSENYAKSQTDKFNSVWKDDSYKKELHGLADLAKQGKLTADTLNNSKYSDVKTAFEGVGIGAKDAANEINALSKKELDNAGATDTTTDSLSDAIDKFKSANSVWDSAKKDVADYGRVSVDTLQSIVKQYPALEDAVAQYQLGLITTSTLMNDLQPYYQKDVDNYKQSLVDKLADNNSFYQQTVLKNSKFVDDFKNLYGIDLTNYKNLAQAKSDVDNKLLKDLIDNWSKFYDAQSDTFTEDYAKLGMAAGTSKDALAEASKIEDEVAKYRKAKSDLDSITLKGFSVPTNDDFKGSKSDADKAAKAAESAEKKKEEAAKKANKDNEEAAKNAAEALKNQYEYELKNIEAYKELDKYTPDKYGVEGFGYYKDLSNLYNKWKNSALDYDDKVSLQEKILSAHKAYEQSIWDTSKQELQTRIDLGQVQEGSIEQLQNLYQLQKLLNSSSMTLVKTKETELEIQKEIYDAQKQYQSNVLSESYNELQKREDLGYVAAGSKEELQNLQEIYKNLTTNPNMAIVNAKDNRAELEKKIYDSKKGILDNEITELNNEKELGQIQEGSLSYLHRLKEIRSDIQKSDLNRIDKQKELLSIDEDINSAQQAYNESQINVIDHLVNIGKLQANSLEYVQRLNYLYHHLNLTLEERKSLQEKIFSAEKSYISQLESDLSDESIVGSYGYRIKQIQDQIDAINNESDAESKALAVEKAKAEWEEAQNNKTVQIYRNGKGFVYEADQSAVTEKKQSLADAEREEQVEKLTKQKNQIQNELDDEKAQLEKALKSLEGYDKNSSDIWNNIQDQISDVLDNIDDKISIYNTHKRKHYNNDISNLELFNIKENNLGNDNIVNTSNTTENIKSIINNFSSNTKNTLSNLAIAFGTYGTNMDNNLSNAINKNAHIPKQSINNIVSYFTTQLTTLVTSCLTYGKNIITELDAGINDKKSRAKLTSDVQKIIDDIIDQFKSGFDIHSPSRIMYIIGSYIMQGLVNGLSSEDIISIIGDKVSRSIKSASDKGAEALNSGVSRWTSIAEKALKLTGHYSEHNLQLLLEQMNTESGGNANAVNLWDSNAKAGHPSQGLMQVIPSTFKSYALEGYNSNILDPLSNIIAAIRYTYSRYGNLNIWGQGHGYATGTDNSLEGWANTDENGLEYKFIPAKNGQYTWLEAGSTVLNANVVKNMEAWGQMNPQTTVLKAMASNNHVGNNVTNNKITEQPTVQILGDLSFPEIHSGDQAQYLINRLCTIGSKARTKVK